MFINNDACCDLLIYEQVTAGIKDKIPPYILEETQQLLKLVKKFNTHYLSVLNGNCTDESQYAIEDVTKKLGEADQAINNVTIMIAMAEGKKL